METLCGRPKGILLNISRILWSTCFAPARLRTHLNEHYSRMYVTGAYVFYCACILFKSAEKAYEDKITNRGATHKRELNY